MTSYSSAANMMVFFEPRSTGYPGDRPQRSEQLQDDLGETCNQKGKSHQKIASLKLAAKAAENKPLAPKGKDRLPTIHFFKGKLLV